MPKSDQDIRPADNNAGAGDEIDQDDVDADPGDASETEDVDKDEVDRDDADPCGADQLGDPGKRALKALKVKLRGEGEAG
ncbi:MULTISPECIES: hypothetical protein [unclassified Saccharothrix]|uniref:hypothetical protein n=1 Tax=unclassified Saccharothrix TaxID=2593673 RepID=UPI00307F5379